MMEGTAEKEGLRDGYEDAKAGRSSHPVPNLMICMISPGFMSAYMAAYHRGYHLGKHERERDHLRKLQLLYDRQHPKPGPEHDREI